MKRWVVLIPGIMGSSLTLDQKEVWPPSASEVIFGYGRVAQLMDDRVKVGEIISKVFIKPVYQSLLDDIQACGYGAGNPERIFVPFPYDWRKSNTQAAARLADHLDAMLLKGRPDEITIVAHSMGGLVARRLLESGDYTNRAWFSAVKRLITLSTPHFGAPVAMVRLLGREKVLGMPGKDVVKLTSDLRYPSLFELAGPPSSTFTLNSPLPGEVPDAIDRFKDSLVNALQLNPGNVDAANAFWSRLDLSKRPAGVRYFCFGGASHTTVTGCEFDGHGLDSTTRESSGDGTVPISSTLVQGIPHGFSRKEHTQIFEDRDLRRALYRFLDAPSDVHPQAADAAGPVGATGKIGLSVNKEVYEVGDPVEIVVSYADATDQPSVSFGLLKIDPDTGNQQFLSNIDVSLSAPKVSSFAVTIHPQLEPGLYQLTSSRPTDDPQPTLFYVTRHG